MLSVQSPWDFQGYRSPGQVGVLRRKLGKYMWAGNVGLSLFSFPGLFKAAEGMSCAEEEEKRALVENSENP